MQEMLLLLSVSRWSPVFLKTLSCICWKARNSIMYVLWLTALQILSVSYESTFQNNLHLIYEQVFISFTLDLNCLPLVVTSWQWKYKAHYQRNISLPYDMLAFDKTSYIFIWVSEVSKFSCKLLIKSLLCFSILNKSESSRLRE